MKFSLLAILSFLTLPAIALAGGSEGFVPLVGIPGLEGLPTFDDYIDALYALAISVAALIAVVQIVIGGAQYMMDDLITSKSAAKERIKNALIGLLIIIAAALILTTINSNLTRLQINAPQIELDNSTPPAVIDEILQNCASDNAGTNCGLSNCSDIVRYHALFGVASNQANTCNAICQEIDGTYISGGLTGTDRCAYTLERYRERMIEVTEQAKASLCTNDPRLYTCDIIPCLGEGLLGCGNSWCQENGNYDYDSESALCYREAGRDLPTEELIRRRTCPSNSMCRIEYCTGDPTSYCERGDNISTFTSDGACNNLGGLFDSETSTCLFIESGAQ